MNKTLLVKIDNYSLPEGYGEDIEELNCCYITDFCSLASNTLIGDLKDENGKPLFHLITPIGNLLMCFKAIDEKTFNLIAEKWYDILGNILHKGAEEKDIAFRFPQKYIGWLLHNDNPIYEQVGKELQKKEGTIFIPSEDIMDEIVMSLSNKVSHAFQEKKGDLSFVVFSNPIIQNSSNIVKEVCVEDFSSSIMKRIEWENMLKEVSKEQISISNQDDTPEEQNLLEENDLIIKVKDVSFKMIFVKGGTFTMGATYEQGSSAESRERPNHIVTLSNFFIGETVVTQALWTAIMGDNPSEYKGLNYPVQSITWYRSQEFINKLNSLSGYNFRLPTEAEWEFAARGGIKSRHFKYAGSNDINKVGWSNRKYREGPHPVGEKSPNELGLFDMSGNVHEWCNDWYGKYESSSQINPKGPTFGNKKVARGGWWNVSDSVSRVTCRRRWDPSSHGFSLRLVLSSHDIIIQNGDSIMNNMMEAGKLLAGKLMSYSHDMDIDDIPTSIDRI